MVKERTDKRNKAATVVDKDKVRSKIDKLFKLDLKTKTGSVLTKYTYDSVKSLNHLLKSHLKKQNYTKLTKIQLKAYPTINKGDDCVIKSQTGSGKTLAYLVPLLNRLINVEPKIKRKDGLRCLIIVPTRELGIQICNTLIKIGRACVNIVPGLLVGGENIKKEKEKIRKGLNIIVGTPGRVKYHLENTSNFIPDKLSSIVIEECDRMFDMGFEREMKFIFEKMRDEVENSQKILVSACITNKVEGLLFKLDLDLEGDLKLIGFNDANMKELDLPDTLSHLYITLDERNKIIYFIMLCKLFLQKKVVIFVATADEANYLEALLKNFNEYYDKVEDQKEPIFQTNINKIHGYMHQKDRSAVFGDFITQDRGFLICTDVGSRGLNFENISIIILFDVSVSYKDYINRVGRTARIDKVGSAISLLNPCEDKYAQKLKENCKITEIDKIELDRLFMDLTGEANNSHYHKINRVINMFNMNEDNNYLARRAFNSFCRAYSMLKDKDCFNLKNMNLHAISKSFGLSDSNSRRRKVISNYNEIKDSKNFLKPKLNDQEKKTDLMRKRIKQMMNQAENTSEFI